MLLIFGIYLKHTETITIFCEYLPQTYHESLYTCKATSSVPCEGDTCDRIDKITGDHAFGKTDADVQAFVMENKGVKKLFKNLGSFFTNLLYLNFKDNLITNVSRADILQYPTLTNLRLSNNKINGIYEDIFENLFLQNIEFDNNDIEYVYHRLSFSKTMLSMNFKRNKCIDMIALSPEDIDKLKDKLILRCSHNPRIGELETNMLNITRHYFDSDDRITELENTVIRLRKAMELPNY